MNFNGLNNEEVKTNRATYGNNKIVEAEPKKFWKEWIANFEDPMLKLLVGITILMAIIAVLGFTEWFEVIGILVSVSIVTLISTKTTMTSDSEYRKLKENNSHEECKVYRNGKVEIVDVNDIVVGDLVIVQSGEKIHADGYLYQGNIKIDNSALNGESIEVTKIGLSGITYDFERGDMTDSHMLLRGALAVDGEGVMKVLKVGMSTMMGEMAKEMSEDEVDSPLKVKLTKLAEQISMFGYIGAIVIGVAILGNSILSMGFNEWFGQPIPLMIKDVLNALLIAITIVVMAVPEGLPLMIAIVLMQNTSKMLKHNVLVRKAVGIETAGSLNILFSDKTGTITKGKLEVVNFIDYDGNEYKKFEDLRDQYDIVAESVIDSMYHNNSAMIVDGEVVGGNMTDRALLEYVKDYTQFGNINAIKERVVTFNSTNKFMATQIKYFEDVDFEDRALLEYVKDYTQFGNINAIKERVVTFNSTNKFMATQIKYFEDVDFEGNVVTLYKGAVERILERCNLTQNELDNFNSMVDEMANNSIRVLALGYKIGEMESEDLPQEMKLIGIVGIRDDVRPEAKVAIKEVQNAGVQVVMITGDRKETAVRYS